MNSNLENFRFKEDPFGLDMPLFSYGNGSPDNFSSPKKSNGGNDFWCVLLGLSLIGGGIWAFFKFFYNKVAKTPLIVEEKNSEQLENSNKGLNF